MVFKMVKEEKNATLVMNEEVVCLLFVKPS